MRALYWASRRSFGEVLFALSIFYVRMPRVMLPQALMLWLGSRGLHLPRALVHHLQIEASRANGCGFCTDMHLAFAMRDGLGERPCDPAAERALTYAREVVAHAVTDATFDALRGHFDERQITEITWLVAFTAYLNTLAKALAIPAQGLCTLGR
jgi:AhpD family alkylhydroperoxidase